MKWESLSVFRSRCQWRIGIQNAKCKVIGMQSKGYLPKTKASPTRAYKRFLFYGYLARLHRQFIYQKWLNHSSIRIYIVICSFVWVFECPQVLMSYHDRCSKCFKCTRYTFKLIVDTLYINFQEWLNSTLYKLHVSERSTYIFVEYKWDDAISGTLPN